MENYLAIRAEGRHCQVYNEGFRIRFFKDLCTCPTFLSHMGFHRIDEALLLDAQDLFKSHHWHRSQGCHWDCYQGIFWRSKNLDF